MTTTKAKNDLLTVVMVVGALIAVGLIGKLVLSGASHVVHSAEAKIARDVTVGQCGTGTFGNGVADVTVTNHSSGLSNYSITVAFYSPSGLHVADGMAFASQVPSGVSEPVVANTPGALTPATYSCKVTDVTRTSA